MVQRNVSLEQEEKTSCSRDDQQPNEIWKRSLEKLEEHQHCQVIATNLRKNWRHPGGKRKDWESAASIKNNRQTAVGIPSESCSNRIIWRVWANWPLKVDRMGLITRRNVDPLLGSKSVPGPLLLSVISSWQGGDQEGLIRLGRHVCLWQEWRFIQRSWLLKCHKHCWIII